ncbi:MAG: pilus assembly protein PilM [Candidatus Omnitrophica bacterium]|nr:pilus assembly protein PilM [Candidatus Omnitrophota bacterium]
MNIDNLIGRFSKKVNSVIVIGIEPGFLKLFDLKLSGEVEIKAFQSLSIPEGKKEQLIQSSIRDFLKANNIFHKNAILVPSQSLVFSKRLQMPVIPDKELLDAIKWKIKDDLPIELSDAVVGFQIINTLTKEDGSREYDIECVAVKENEVKSQVEMIKGLGLSCLAVVLAPFGYVNLINKYFSEDSKKTVGILHVDENKSYFVICKNEKLEFYRELPFSVNELRKALSSVLITEKGKLQLNPEEINDILFKGGIPWGDKEAYKDKFAASQILGLLRSPLDMLIQEIKRSLAYYETQFKGAAIEKIYLNGKGLKVPNLDKFLQEASALNIENFPLIGNLKAGAGIESDVLLENYAFVASGLDYENNINLLPQEYRSEKIEKLQVMSLRWVFFIAALLLLVFYLLAHVGVDVYQKRLDNAEFQLKVISEIKDIKARTDAFDNFVSSLRSREVPVGLLLKKISMLAPREVFLNSMEINSETKTGSFSGLVKSTNADPNAALAKFISDLGSSGNFADIDISNVTKGALQGFDVMMFEVTFKLK